MTTLKLSKTPKEPSTATRSPVRRADPLKRSRTSPPAVAPKPSAPQDRPVAGKADRPTQSTTTRQRNHRFDGTAKDITPDSRAPAERAVQRGEFKRDVAQQAGPNRASQERYPAKTGDTDRDASHRDASGRDTPRRGGKVRDGFVPGGFNKDRATNPMFSAAKPAPANTEQPRLSKRMAELGLCSRREADEWIVNGWVTVNDQVVDTLGTRIAPDARIEISKAARQHQAETVTILVNKPVGYVSGQAEDGYQPAIVLINPDNQWHEDGQQRNPTEPKFKRGHLQGLAPAGRLDIDSTGLLVFTQDGRIARQLIGDDSSVEKEYLVRVEGELSAAGLKLLNHGLELDGVKLKPAKVSWQNEDQLRFVLREGRKRQIRRMCELVGLNVVGLKRVRIGSVSLGRLPMGSWRYLRLGERF